LAKKVSLKKQRLDGKVISLDLALITTSVVATGFPAAGIEQTYRNSRQDFITFMNNAYRPEEEQKRVFFEIVTMEKKALMEKYFDFKPEDSET